MRPLHTKTLTFEAPLDDALERAATFQPGMKYAVLSHRWADDEVLFDDIKTG